MEAVALVVSVGLERDPLDARDERTHAVGSISIPVQHHAHHLQAFEALALGGGGHRPEDRIQPRLTILRDRALPTGTEDLEGRDGPVLVDPLMRPRETEALALG